MALWRLSCTAAGAAKSPLLTSFTDSLVGPGRCGLPRQLAVRCPGVRRLSLFGSSEQSTAGESDSNSKILRHKEPATRKQTGLRRVPSRANPFLDVWDPVMGTRSLRQMLNTMERLFDDPLLGMTPASIASDFRAPWNVKEDDDAFRLRFDMPGLGKDEVKVYMEDGDLVIKGEHKEDHKEDKEERPAARTSYYTRMKLPEDVKTEEMKAELKNGVLQLVVPKSKEAPKKNVIEIKLE
ncbi:hypothetical protein KC19_9G121800 [Ceratodon purpureus]|uniref:SHSP domain-containing protein n=1 Tax=Ceratodon purpureus TaxID=3225 RepID=A0A8T0GTB1_CERPU|nr:hypothetical protein KC19_9G121800 [Ceratodon purpureus]